MAEEFGQNSGDVKDVSIKKLGILQTVKNLLKKI